MNRPSYFSEFNRIFLPGCILIVVISLFIFLLERNHISNAIRANEQVSIAHSKKLILEYFDPIRADLMFLANSNSLHLFLDGARDRQGLQHDFVVMAQQERNYDQIRLLDETGMEIIRVNQAAGIPKVVPDNELQPKGKRYFFADAYKLDRGQIFISPLDLNIEQDKIEVPHKPMLRLATPIFDSNGKKRGIILINVLGNELIKRISPEMQAHSPRLMLLNKEGYWLKGRTPDEEWGFMFPDRKNMLFARYFPSSWDQINTQKVDEQLLNREGLFTYSKVNPLRSGELSSTGSPLPFASSQKTVSTGDYYWIIATHISSSTFNKQISGSLYWILPLSCLSIAVFAFISFRSVTTKRAKAQHDQEIRKAHDRLNLILNSAAEGIIGIDRDGTCLFCNSSSLSMTGFKQPEHLIGNNIHTFIHHSHADGRPYEVNDSRIVQTCLNGIESHGEDEVFWRADNSSFPVEYWSHPIVQNEEVIGAVITFIDITKRKELEKTREDALSQVKKLEGIIPICMHCKKIRDDQKTWNKLEEYISDHSDAMFSHGICPDCLQEQLKILGS